MAPRTRGSQSTTAVAITPPLQGVTITVSGSFPGLTHGAIEKRVSALGGSIARNVNANTKMLITTETDFKGNTSKVAQAASKGLPTVSIGWLAECETKNTNAATAAYDFGSTAPVPATATTNAAASAEATATAPDATVDAATDATADTKPTRKRTAKASSDVKKTEPKRKKAKVDKDEAKDEAKDDSADTAMPDNDAGDADVIAPAADGDEAPNQYLRKGSKIEVSLDKCCDMPGFKVYICPQTRLIYDATLYQSNHGRNNNKFYIVQLIHNPSTGNHRVWTRWGRVGEDGATASLGDGSLENALKTFIKKFRDKAGVAWENRDQGTDDDKKYLFSQQNYEADEALENKLLDGGISQPTSATVAPSKLELPVQNLMKLIFNDQYMRDAMSNMKYDARKLPLGKLSKYVIMKAYDNLKQLADLIDDRNLASTKYNTSWQAIVERLSNQYLTAIPHDYGRDRPPILNTDTFVKKEIELLDNLLDMKATSDLMNRKVKTEGTRAPNPLDQQFAGLSLGEMTPLDSSTSEYGVISKYLHGTCGSTHHVRYDIDSIFRIGRPDEDERFREFAAPTSSDRRLLWHGSRATNFGGILSQGLRIAPPEAPVSGYMFGKGIYLADMSSKSAGYTCPYNSGGTGLLLLCEAELGSPMLELTNADYHAESRAKSNGSIATWGKGRTGPTDWTDASCIHPSLAGVKMPNMAITPGATNVSGASLHYNEYIVYDISQVKLRYLLRVRM